MGKGTFLKILLAERNKVYEVSPVMNENEVSHLSFTFATKLGLHLKAGDVVTVRLRKPVNNYCGFVRDGRSYSDTKTAKRFRDRRPAAARMFEIMGRSGDKWSVQEII